MQSISSLMRLSTPYGDSQLVEVRSEWWGLIMKPISLEQRENCVNLSKVGISHSLNQLFLKRTSTGSSMLLAHPTMVDHGSASYDWRNMCCWASWRNRLLLMMGSWRFWLKWKPSSMADLSLGLWSIQVIYVAWHQTTCWCSKLYRVYHLVCSTRMKTMLVVVGDKYNTSVICCYNWCGSVRGQNVRSTCVNFLWHALGKCSGSGDGSGV